LEFTAIIIAAGKGQRMSPLNDFYPKPLLPVAHQALIDYQITYLRNIGITKFVFVVHYLKEVLTQHVKTRWTGQIEYHFIEQPQYSGIAAALLLAAGYAGDYLVACLGDTFFIPNDLSLGIKKIQDAKAAAVLSVRRVNHPALIMKECSIIKGADGRVKRIVEKPARPFNTLKPCGVYFFTRAIFTAIKATPPSSLRGEVEITDSIQTLIDQGAKVHTASTIAWDMNITYPGDLLTSNLKQLRHLKLKSLIAEDVKLPAGSQIVKSVIGAGVKADKPVVIKNSLIFPDTNISGTTRLENMIISPDFQVKV
jgi:dTDP-glucose pyrophosphorylase